MEMPFSELSLNDRAKLVSEQGDYLVTVDYYNYKVKLYSLGIAYVEVFLSPTSKEIEKITTVDSEGLKKYLSRINVSLK